MHLLGGKLYLANPKLQNLDYVGNGYHVLNFNDAGNSFMSLFTFMVCSYMPEFVEAINVVTGISLAGYAFCGIFFFFGVNIIFNVFCAFTIDVFKQLRTDINAQEDEGPDQEEKKPHYDDPILPREGSCSEGHRATRGGTSKSSTRPSRRPEEQYRRTTIQ